MIGVVATSHPFGWNKQEYKTKILKEIVDYFVVNTKQQKQN